MIKNKNKYTKFTQIIFLLVFTCSINSIGYAKPETKIEIKDVLKTYSDIAHAGYEDSFIAAKKMQSEISEFLKTPNQENLRAARDAWIAARVPYQQTEAYRFGNRIVDDWEGRVNAWPLDEGLIDYVDLSYYGEESDENELYIANVIANKTIKISGETLDVSKITKKLLSDKLQEAGGIEANVATGFHAIEFLLWGQDLNGTGPGAGQRPATDYDLKNCSNGNCDRRTAYLRSSIDLLLEDLAWMVAQWAPEGEARKSLFANEQKGLISIFTGLGSLSFGELAGERMKLGLLLHDPEEEHDCFSDNTHNSHYYNALGIQNVYLGKYKRTNGKVVSGPSPSDLVKAVNKKADKALRNKLNQTMRTMRAIVKRAETKEAYDQMIAAGNKAGNALVNKAIGRLLAQTKSLERAIAALKLQSIEFERSESLDNPNKVSTDG